jgi:hypothetical protein
MEKMGLASNSDLTYYALILIGVQDDTNYGML